MLAHEPLRVSSTDQMWRQYTHKDFDDAFPNAWPFCVRGERSGINQGMKICTMTRCFYVDTDAQVIIEHFLRHHVKAGQAVMVDHKDVQINLAGGEITEEDRQAVILASIPDERYQCPFCFNVYPHARATRFFLDDGSLSKRVVCRKDAGGCGATMLPVTMTVTRGSPIDFGRFVGSYPKFWFKTDHDRWMIALKKMYPSVKSLAWDDVNQPMSQFWLGYGEMRPEFAQKQKEAKMLKDAIASGQVAPEEDQVDEAGR